MTCISIPALAGKYCSAVSQAAGLQGRVLWCDAEANLWDLDSREKVADLVKHCKDSNITTIVVDVKPLCGLVLYKSAIAPKLTEWRGRKYPADYDLLDAMVQECRRAGVEVYAAINVFSEGQTDVPGGPAFTHPEWQCVKYEVERWAHGTTPDSYPLDGTNTDPLPGRLTLITKQSAVPKTMSLDGMIATVDSAGKVSNISAGPTFEKITVPDGGYALAASGPAADWLRKNSLVGSTINLEGKPRFVPVAKAADPHFAVFVNPANPKVREYEFSVIKEIITNYAVDGIVFDRMRYPGMYADFSEESRRSFESWLGVKVERFPEDIFVQSPLPSGQITRGRYFGQWMEWRAKQIHDFVADARRMVKSLKPTTRIAGYVGSWYSSYYDVGVNWASPNHQPPYDFALPTYKSTGYADLMDWLCTGCYYEYATREEARAAKAEEGGSVEAAGQESNSVIEDDTFVYASLYVLQYQGKPDAFERAIAACNANTQGVMIFDLCYIRDYNWWDLLKRVFAKPQTAPHQVPGLADKVKEVRQLVEESGNK